ncbi:MAG: ribosomal protein S18-alanine N-acetyltransferase [Gammaproteobacteria bacterium]|nr:ribosomal protein S18-alanine N-acetyltransferase [Gammaproteobacteria bacterium]
MQDPFNCENSTANLKFIKMTEEMLSYILIIESQSYSVGWSVQLFKDCINKGYSCQVLMQDGIIIGYSIVQTVVDEYHILNISVAPEHRGKGLGKYQLEAIRKSAESEAINRILLEVRASSKPARKLYMKSGFHIIGKRKNYYPAPGMNAQNREDAFVMEMALY